MKKVLIISLVTVIVSGMGLIAFAQSGNADTRDKIMKIVFDRVSTKLNLNNDQKAKAMSVLENSKRRTQPLIAQLKSNHEQIEKLGTDGVYDSQKANEFAEAQTKIMKQLFLEKEKTKAELFAIMTPEQRAEAIKMRDSVKEKIMNRLGSGSGILLERLLAD